MPSKSTTITRRLLNSIGTPSITTIIPCLLLLFLPKTSIVHAAKTNNACSCLPSKYSFRLNLSQDCSTNDIADNDGIRESLCFLENNADYSSNNGRSDNNNNNDNQSNNNNNMKKEEPVRSLQQKQQVVEIISVQFLEFDTSDTLDVIHTDETYVETSMTDGDTFQFVSSSSVSNNDGGESVGGASLILYGVNRMGDIVRNRFLWLFDTDSEECDARDSVMEGDGIGWVTVVSAVAII